MKELHVQKLLRTKECDRSKIIRIVFIESIICYFLAWYTGATLFFIALSYIVLPYIFTYCGRYNVYSLDDLEELYGIKANVSPCGKLVNLKYNQIESPKTNNIVRECRGLILEIGSWNVIAQPFYRFFNYGEGGDDITTESFKDMTVMEKLDGSLMTLFNYEGEWRMTTSGGVDNNSDVLEAHSIGYLNTDITFMELFYDALGKESPDWRDRADETYTYTFELTSPENRTVKKYEERSVTLIGARDCFTNRELNYEQLCELAEDLGVPMCKKFKLKTLRGIMSSFKRIDPLDEGYVAVNYKKMDEFGNFERVKIKNPTYVAKHQLKDSACNSRKALLGVVLNGEIDEVVSVFEEYEPALRELEDKWNAWVKKHEDWLTHIKENDLTPKEIGLQTPKDIHVGLIFSIHKGKLKDINDWVQSEIEKRTYGNACKHILDIIEG
jgi:hypothetical protein